MGLSIYEQTKISMSLGLKFEGVRLLREVYGRVCLGSRAFPAGRYAWEKSSAVCLASQSAYSHSSKGGPEST